MKRNTFPFVPIYSYFMRLECVREVIDTKGPEGLGIVITLLDFLHSFRGGMAKLSNVNVVAASLHKRADIVRKIITDHSVFRLTPDGLFFYSPYLRKVMKLKPEIESEKDYYLRVICQPTCNQYGILVETTENEPSDNQTVSEPYRNIKEKKDKYINIKNNSSSTSNKKISGEIFSEEDEKSFL